MKCCATSSSRLFPASPSAPEPKATTCRCSCERTDIGAHTFIEGAGRGHFEGYCESLCCRAHLRACLLALRLARLSHHAMMRHSAACLKVVLTLMTFCFGSVRQFVGALAVLRVVSCHVPLASSRWTWRGSICVSSQGFGQLGTWEP